MIEMLTTVSVEGSEAQLTLSKGLNKKKKTFSDIPFFIPEFVD